jgi:hypothetical protein
MSSLPIHGGSDMSNLLMSSSSRAVGASSEALDFQSPAPYGARAIGSQGLNPRQFEASRYLLPQDRALSKEIAFELLTQGLFLDVWVVRACSGYLMGRRLCFSENTHQSPGPLPVSLSHEIIVLLFEPLLLWPVSCRQAPSLRLLHAAPRRAPSTSGWLSFS